jgi:hypothetical protein
LITNGRCGPLLQQQDPLPGWPGDWALPPDAFTSEKAAAMDTRTVSVALNDADEHLIEKTCDSSLEPGECFFCTGPETD